MAPLPERLPSKTELLNLNSKLNDMPIVVETHRHSGRERSTHGMISYEAHIMTNSENAGMKISLAAVAASRLGAAARMFQDILSTMHLIATTLHLCEV